MPSYIYIVYKSAATCVPLEHFIIPWLVIWHFTLWRHQKETFSALLALCSGNSPVTVGFPAQRPVTRSFDVFFDLRLNKRLRKQWWGWRFETPSHPLWRHCIICQCTVEYQWLANNFWFWLKIIEALLKILTEIDTGSENQFAESSEFSTNLQITLQQGDVYHSSTNV